MVGEAVLAKLQLLILNGSLSLGGLLKYDQQPVA
jgi:hypothetical protein